MARLVTTLVPATRSRRIIEGVFRVGVQARVRNQFELNKMLFARHTDLGLGSHDFIEKDWCAAVAFET